ncbi:ABC transporter substrate-binding protein, partial [Jeotgalicoccus huakuii]|nr:ABC transporter substrate-binding protein [Jeotgalicoccus huakuii]
GDENYNLVRKGVGGLMLMSLNQSVEALAKPKVWEAIKWAVDYEGIQKNIVPLNYKVHQTLVPEGFPAALNENPFKKDIAKAKALLAEAGV